MKREKKLQRIKKLLLKWIKNSKKQERLEGEIETVKTEKEHESVDGDDEKDGEDDSDSDFLDDEDEDDDDFSDNPLRNLNNKNKNKMSKKEKETEKEIKMESIEEDQLSDDTEEEIEKSKKRKKLNDKNEFLEEKVKKKDDENENYDTDEKAEIRAIARKMLRKKNRLNIFNKSYNRYAFDDLDQAPKWFVEDENQHNKPMKPVTKEEIRREKEELREINTKLPKKVLEAKKQEKKGRSRWRCKKVKKIAQNIVNQDEINEKSKITQIEKLYKRELSKLKEKKKYVVSKAYKQSPRTVKKGGRNVKFVDRRMKKEVRAEKMRNKRKK